MSEASRRGRDPPQRPLGARPATRLQGAPTPERLQHARCHLRVGRVQCQHMFGNEFVASAVGAVELGLIALRECTDQRADAVRVGEREGGVPGQRANLRQRVGGRRGGLQGEPFVDDERIVAVAYVEIVKSRGAC